jgi:hypothetical protein
MSDFFGYNPQEAQLPQAIGTPFERMIKGFKRGGLDLAGGKGQERKERYRAKKQASVQREQKIRAKQKSRIRAGFETALKKFSGLTSVDDFVERFGTLDDTEIKNLLRESRKDDTYPQIKAFNNNVALASDMKNLDDLTFKAFSGKSPEYKKGLLKLVPYSVMKDFKPKEGNVPAEGVDKIVKFLKKFSIDESSIRTYIENIDTKTRGRVLADDIAKKTKEKLGEKRGEIIAKEGEIGVSEAERQEAQTRRQTKLAETKSKRQELKTEEKRVEEAKVERERFRKQKILPERGQQKARERDIEQLEQNISGYEAQIEQARQVEQANEIEQQRVDALNLARSDAIVAAQTGLNLQEQKARALSEQLNIEKRQGFVKDFKFRVADVRRERGLIPRKRQVLAEARGKPLAQGQFQEVPDIKPAERQIEKDRRQVEQKTKQIESIKKRIADREAQLNSIDISDTNKLQIQNEIKNLQSDASKAQGDIAKLQNQINKQQAELGGLQKELPQLSRKGISEEIETVRQKGQFPAGFSVEEQLYDTIAEYSKRANLVSVGFEDVKTPTAGERATFRGEEIPARQSLFFSPKQAGLVKVGDIKGAFQGTQPIASTFTNLDFGTLEADDPKLVMRGKDLYNYDPNLMGVPGGYRIGGNAATQYAELQQVVDVLPVGEGLFTASHARGVGYDMNVGAGSGVRVKTVIDPYLSAIETEGGEERLQQNPTAPNPLGQIPKPRQTEPIPFMRKSKVNVSSSGAYELQPNPLQLEERINVKPAQTFTTDRGIGGYSPTPVAFGSFMGQPQPTFASPFAGNIDAKELVESYTGTDIEQESLRRARPIYPTLQQQVRIKQG